MPRDALARRLAPALALCLLILALTIQVSAAADRRLLVFEGADYSGFDYRQIDGADLEACKASCLGDPACRALTYNSKASRCFLKSDFGTLATFEGAVAARIASGAPSPENLPTLDLSFLPQGIEDEAQSLKRLVGREPVAVDTGFSALVKTAAGAAATGESRSAATSLRRALAVDPAAGTAWLDLARALLAIAPADYTERYQLPEQASGAAYLAVGLAGDEAARAQALAVLAESLGRREIWRPAIEAYKASLALAEIPAVRALSDAARAAHGFRMLDYTVDSDTAEPRACVQFSENLSGDGVEIADYVRLDGLAPPAVTREAQQICVEGLKHGETYRLSLREGLASTVGESLLEPVDLTIYVRDRAPSARFTGRNYVLPRAGAQGIPIVSVNTTSLDVEIYRIGSRALAETLRASQFLSQLSLYGARDIAEEKGEKLWEGELAVKSDLNREVVTAFPIDTVLSDPEPGVFVMIARPAEALAQDWDQQATQWFIVTDLGLASLKAEDGLHVFARSLASARPLAGVEVSLVAAGNDELGTATTDADGHVHFAPGLTRGTGGMAPALVTADRDGDSAFLDLAAASFDLTDRGVEGRPAPGAIDVFTYTERGVYRPGESVHLMALARDAAGLSLDTPLTIVVERPDGVEYRRVLSAEPSAGGHALDIDLGADVLTGTWRALVHGDPKAPALAEAKFLVEDFVPERLEFDLGVDADRLDAVLPASATIDGRFLYGAPAAGLGLEGEIVIRPARGAPQGYSGYSFGLADEEVTARRQALAGLPATDAAGAARFEVALAGLPETTGLLEADVTVRMREAGGRAVERRVTLPVRSQAPLVGVKPLFADGQVAEGTLAGFEVIGVDRDLARIGLGTATWDLIKLARSYEWYRVDGDWRYEAVESTSRVANGEIEIGADAPARIEAAVEWGRYRLEVKAGGAATSVDFSAGWYAAEAAAETPDILEVALDKASYRPGETAQLRLSPRFAGTALVTVMAESVLAMKAVEVPEGGTTVDFPVDERWGAGAYVTAMLYRPMNVDASQNPARAVGIDWLEMASETRTIGVEIELPDLADPRTTLGVPVSLTGLEPGEKAYLTLAAVDVGILNLTNYKPPEPEGWFYGQRGLGVEIRDLYGRLIDGLQGSRGQVRSGGDAAGLSMTGAPPTEQPVALFSGIVAADADGKAEVAFEIPAFNGTLRVMAVAWSAARVGHGARDVIVREPVVVTASLPRFLAPGDRSRLFLDIDNIAGPAGRWQLDVAIDGPVTSALNAADLDFELAAGGRRQIAVPLSAAGVGQARVEMRLTHATGLEIARDYNLSVRPAQPPVTRRSVQTLAAGTGRLTATPDLVVDLVPGSARVSLAVTRGLLLDVPGVLDALDRYPYGCAEQVTSRALPLVYLNDVARHLGLASDDEIAARIAAAIASVLQRQGANGSFGLWEPGGDDLWLDAYVTDFLTRARETGHAVPARAFDLALSRLENGLAYYGEVAGDAEDLSYALYVLARNRRASVGDLRYYADEKLGDLGSPLAQAQLGAALSLYGDGERAGRAFRAALADLQGDGEEWDYRSDYGSQLRDSAATLALAAESQAAGIALPAVARVVEARRAAKTYSTTQEDAWLLLAAHALQGEDETIALTVDGVEHRGRLERRIADAQMRSASLSLVNSGPSDVEAVVTVTGVPAEPEPPAANGLKLERSYYTLTGDPVGTQTLAQNERLVVVLKLTEERERRAHLLVEDYLPAGLEIDNPRLVAGGDTGDLAWLGETATPAHVEFRDDRFTAAFDRPGGEAETLTLAYVVRAVTPGRYAHPPAVAQDMYEPSVNARTRLGEIEVIGPAPR